MKKFLTQCLCLCILIFSSKAAEPSSDASKTQSPLDLSSPSSILSSVTHPENDWSSKERVDLFTKDDFLRKMKKAGFFMATMSGLGVGLLMCHSDPKSCSAALGVDGAAIVSGTVLTSLYSAQIQSLLGIGTIAGMAMSPALLHLIVASTLVVGIGASTHLMIAATNVTMKTGMCQSYCTRASARMAAPKLFNPAYIADKDQDVNNALWCLKYCPIATNQRYTCEIVNMTPMNRMNDLSNFFVLNGQNLFGFHRYISLDVFKQSKLYRFIQRNQSENPKFPSQPNFCLKYMQFDNDKQKAQFLYKYNMMEGINNALLAASQDPFLACSHEMLLKKYPVTASRHANEGPKLRKVQDIQKFQKDFLQYLKDMEDYYVLREKNDPGLNDLIKQRYTINKWTGLFQNQYCTNILNYVRTITAQKEDPATHRPLQ